MVFIVFRIKYQKCYLYSVFIFSILTKMLSIYNLIDKIMKEYKKLFALKKKDKTPLGQFRFSQLTEKFTGVVEA